MEKIGLRHSELGGVTLVSTYFSVARRVEPDEMGNVDAIPSRKRSRSPPVGFIGASLGRVIKSTLPGRSCPAPGPTDFDSSTDVLDWAQRGAYLKLPSVFSRDTGFVRRRLSDKELLAAMDVPASVVKHATAERQAAWAAEITVPFKSRFEIIRLLGGVAHVNHTGSLGDREPLLPHQSRLLLRSGDSVEREGPTKKQNSGKAKEDPPRPEEGTDRGPSIPGKASAASHLVAAKSDDAEIPVRVWDERCRTGCPGMEASVQAALNGSETRVNEAWDRMLAGMRIWMLRLWKRRVASSFWSWWKIYRSQRLREHLPVCQPSVESGLTALGHAVDASWWEWDRGSAPFFWRYPPEWVVLMRDGLPPRFIGDPTQYTKRQIPPGDPETREKERRKVDTVRQRGYVRPFPGLKALLNFFSVSKGGSDIRMVYDGTASGLNAVLYAPWFALTTLECMLRSVGPETYSADNDYGEMFHNFWMHPVLRQYCGIDLTGLFPDEAAASPGGACAKRGIGA